MNRILYLIILTVFLQSCLSVARISDFPTTSESIDFDQYSKERMDNKEPFWTLETSYEYYIEENFTLEKIKLIGLITNALKNNGYRIFISDQDSQYIIGKRGLRANEWNTRTGVYYKIDSIQNKTQIYIKSRITQDITGGPRDNRAKKVGVNLEMLIKKGDE
ncbi:MAG: hypothetical protein IPO21_03205 [Bacteroidales bacterium]|nr:hypothetical protein [Bacteroidales bacterium]